MKILSAMIAAAFISTAGAADNGNGSNKPRAYEVTITNITRGQSFTPVLVATHKNAIRFFELGAAPSQEIADIAEGGATGGLKDLLDNAPQYAMDNASTDGGLIGPGESRTVMVYGSRDFDRLSLAGMLLPTNDTLVAVNAMTLPRLYASTNALAYDAGSEENDELCASIPGPHCGGAPFSAGLAEGFVHVSRGISGNGDLAPDAYDWRNPVARITVRRID